MNWFIRLLDWLMYRNYTPENLALGSEKADKLRKDIKCSVHLLLRSIDPQVFERSVSAYVDKAARLAEAKTHEEVEWWVLLHEREKKLELRCILPACYDEKHKRAPLVLFSSLEQGEMPVRYLIQMHRALKLAINHAVQEYGGTGYKLKPFVQIAHYKF